MKKPDKHFAILWGKRIFIYLIGLYCMAIGVVFSAKSALGVSPVGSLANVLYQIGLSEQLPGYVNLGNCTTAVYCLYILVEFLILRREFKPRMLLQLVASFLFGQLVNLATAMMFFLPTPPNYAVQMLYLLCSVPMVAVGKDGRLTVIKDMHLREPYVGQVNLVSGEIAEDFAMYFTASEQTPSLVSLGVLVSDEKVESAGGLIVQLMPGASEEAIQSIETSAGMFMDISGTMKEYHLEGAVNQLLLHLEPEILERRDVRYSCDCSRERVERALITLGARELTDMIDEQHGALVNCHFCKKAYGFTEDELRALLAAATAKSDQ